jgi:TetR/AcrR family transcriptional regulator
VARPNDVRGQILDAATELFAARGFDGTPLDDIASRVGIRKPSLLYHFRSKEELRQQVLGTILGHWNDTLPQLFRAATSGQGQFDGLLEALTGFFAADPNRARLLMREILDRPATVKQLVMTNVRPWVEVACQHIVKGQQRKGVLQAVDAEAWVLHVINLVLSSVVIHACTDGIVGDPRRSVQELKRIARTSLFISPEEPYEATYDKFPGNK